ncbi:mRNA interferase MqsR [Coriobacteriaceae bacterium CHKCI002]|nr:mRNA interferase MqsR [Coriobacteriaceae bacterium CHKCI002]
MIKKRRIPHYDLFLVKRLINEGRYFETKKSLRWLATHGYDQSIAKRIILSLDEAEFVESLPPPREGGTWADVYRCSYEDEEIEGTFYVKFILSEDMLVVVLMSCKEWGYGW